jgi:isopentenyl-diphosphate Delta-isomerase
MTDRFKRKRDHIALCNEGPVSYTSHEGLFSDFYFVHHGMPELSMDELELETRLLDSELSAPLMVTGMTGGPDEAGEINREIAAVCGELGLAFGVGSQRVITREPGSLDTFKVRASAPGVTLFGNLGINQARDMGVDAVRALFESIEADYLAIHLNPAMELVQPGAEADSDFTAGYETVSRLVDALDGRLIVKECGCGLSPTVVRRLKGAGVRAVDVSGSGGTSWVKVEALRATGQQATLGETFSEWGIPTLAATGLASRTSDIEIIASGGVDDGLKAAKALAMGATVVGCARPVLQAFMRDGKDGAYAYLSTLISGIRMAMALTGVRTPAELREVPRVVGPQLERWLTQVPIDEVKS